MTPLLPVCAVTEREREEPGEDDTTTHADHRPQDCTEWKYLGQLSDAASLTETWPRDGSDFVLLVL